MAKKNRGREVIDILSEAFKNGEAFAGLAEMREFVMVAGGFKLHELYEIGAWERQARYELARTERMSVTNPTRTNGYSRNPNASPRERVVSRTKLIKDLNKRFENVGLLLEVDGEQVDASPSEIYRAGQIGMLQKVFTTVARELEIVGR